MTDRDDAFQFLLDRLDDFERSGLDGADVRDWYGHVAPAMSRARSSLAHARDAGEPVAAGWQRRLLYETAPGSVAQWEQCSDREATDIFAQSPRHEYRKIYTHPAPAQPVAVPAGWREALQSVVDVSRSGSDTIGFLLELHRVAGICAAALAASPVAPTADGGERDDLEEAVRLAEVGEYLFNACRYSGGDGYTEPREMGIDWQWQQSAPEQYGEGMLLAAATKWHDEQAEDGIVTEARKLRSALTSSPIIADHKTQMDRDIGILLATIDFLAEATGEGPEGEDAAMIAQIKADHEARLAHTPVPQPGGVKVKALEWRDGPPYSGMQEADCVFGQYWAWDGCWSRGSLPGTLVAGSMDAAKAAAQADYERRVLSALEPYPAQASAAKVSYSVTEPLTFTYRNWRGEVAERHVIPRFVHFGATEWHREPQWLLRAFDMDKGADRDFAMKDIAPSPSAWNAGAEADKALADQREANLRARLDKIHSYASAIETLAKGGALPLPTPPAGEGKL